MAPGKAFDIPVVLTADELERLQSGRRNTSCLTVHGLV